MDQSFTTYILTSELQQKVNCKEIFFLAVLPALGSDRLKFYLTIYFLAAIHLYMTRACPYSMLDARVFQNEIPKSFLKIVLYIIHHKIFFVHMPYLHNSQFSSPQTYLGIPRGTAMPGRRDH